MNVCCIAAVVEDSGFFSLGVFKYVVCLCKGYDGWCVLCLYCRACSSARVGKCECFVMQMVYVCVLCVSGGSFQCCVLHGMQLVNTGRRCKRRPYVRGILQSRSHDCLVGSHE